MINYLRSCNDKRDPTIEFAFRRLQTIGRGSGIVTSGSKAAGPSTTDIAAAFRHFRKVLHRWLAGRLFEGLPGKPKGFDGSEVERYFREGKIKEIADYWETDVVGTYQVWLRYELFRGALGQSAFEASQINLADFINARSN